MDERVAEPQARTKQAPAERVPVTRFSTAGLAPADQFQAWSDYVRPLANLSLTAPAETGFAAEFTTWNLGTMVFCDVTLPADAPPRTWRHATSPGADHWYLCLERRGRKAPSGLDGIQPARSLNFRSLARPHDGTSQSAGAAALMMPRDLYADSAPMLERVREHIPDAGPGAMLADYMLVIGRHMNELALADAPALAAATKAMIAFCLAPSMDRAEMAMAPLNATCFERARQLILANLLSPELDAGMLCRRMGVSRSRLYRLFDGVGGVNNYIRRQRLLLARNALCDLADLRSIGVIAASVGFADASGFSRAYHREFGCSPSDTRMEHLAGRAIALPVRPLPRTATSARLDELLRRIRA